MGVVFIIIGIVVWYFAASNHQSSKHNPDHEHRAYEAHAGLGCLPFALAFGLMGLGIYLLISS